MNAASALPGPLHAAGLRSFPVLASYIRTMPSLHGMTGEADDAVRARRLADVKIGFLSTPLPGSNPELWRFPFHNRLLQALLELEAPCADRLPSPDSSGGPDHGYNLY